MILRQCWDENKSSSPSAEAARPLLEPVLRFRSVSSPDQPSSSREALISQPQPPAPPNPCTHVGGAAGRSRGRKELAPPHSKLSGLCLQPFFPQVCRSSSLHPWCRTHNSPTDLGQKASQVTFRNFFPKERTMHSSETLTQF